MKHRLDRGPRDLEVPATAVELALSGQQCVWECAHIGVGARSLRPTSKVIKAQSVPSSSSPEETDPPESRVSGVEGLEGNEVYFLAPLCSKPSSFQSCQVPLRWSFAFLVLQFHSIPVLCPFLGIPLVGRSSFNEV